MISDTFHSRNALFCQSLPPTVGKRVREAKESGGGGDAAEELMGFSMRGADEGRTALPDHISHISIKLPPLAERWAGQA